MDAVGEVVQVRLYAIDREAGQIGGSETGVGMSDAGFAERYHWTMK